MFKTIERLLWPMTSGEQAPLVEPPTKPVKLDDILGGKLPGHAIVRAYALNEISMLEFAAAVGSDQVAINDFRKAGIDEFELLDQHQNAANKLGFVGKALGIKPNRFTPFSPSVPSGEEYAAICRSSISDDE